MRSAGSLPASITNRQRAWVEITKQAGSLHYDERTQQAGSLHYDDDASESGD
ncbi:MAG: hypothetical protein ABGZ23_11310 [Fuerstiella sp.]